MDVVGATSYLPLRHARIGRVGEAGLLPPGWRVEHLDGIRVLDVGFRGLPWITLELHFAAGISGDYAGIGLGPYLPAPKDAVVTLSTAVSLSALENVQAAFLVLREWRSGGEFVTQSILAATPGDSSVRALSRPMSDEGNIAEAVFLVKRHTHEAGRATVTLRGLAFGGLADHNERRIPSAGTI